MEQPQVQAGEGARVLLTRDWVETVVPKDVTANVIKQCCKGTIDSALLATAEEGSYKLLVKRVESPKPGARFFLTGPNEAACDDIIDKITDEVIRMTLNNES